ncbi:hypothetical protein GCM10027048_44970 [Hymenobacter coalescens]
MRPLIKRLAALLLVLALAVGARFGLLPFPFALWNGTWTPPAASLDASRVVRTEYYRGFFQRGRSFGQARSQAILAVLQDSLLFGGDTTPNFTHLLVCYDATGHILGYTDLDLFSDARAVASTKPGGFRRGAVLTATGRQRLLRALGYAPPYTVPHLRQQ